MALTPVPVRIVPATVATESPVIFGLTTRTFLECAGCCKPIPLISFLNISIASTTVSPSKNEWGNRAWSVCFSIVPKDAVQSIRQGHVNAAHFRFGNISKDTRMHSSKNVPASSRRKNHYLIPGRLHLHIFVVFSSYSSTY